MLSAIPLAFLELVRAASAAPFSFPGLLLRWGVIVAILLAARFGRLQHTSGLRWQWPWRGLAVTAVTVVVALGYVWTGATWLAWLTLGCLYTLLLILTEGAWALAGALKRGWTRLLARGTVAGLGISGGGLTPVLIQQVETRYSDEEFFAALTAIALMLFTGLLLGVHLQGSARTRDEDPRPGLRMDVRWIAISLVLLALAGGWAAVHTYQTSFYPPEAPPFDGISAETPFLCGETSASAGENPDGATVFEGLLDRVAANPSKTPPQFGMLALATGSLDWAEIFRDAILLEAAANQFAGPAHSVKSVQYNAALRLYYLWKVQEAFPDLFTAADQSQLQEWFAAINARALTVEWVDWLYALAFSKRPEGPYENQENGAGLLALLEVSGYAPPDLSPANRDYLERNERGWQERFRNSDDAYIYQLEWLNNALFQSLYTGQLSAERRRLAFEWLLLQSLPDGAIFGYNHPSRVSIAGAAYLGAGLLNDPRLLWLADQNLARLKQEGRYLNAQPGLEKPLSLAGEPPQETSCLLYGDSGLPNQLGPLAPDKIVFRDGWTADATYLLLNLRFAGWHRYKATNTVMLLYQAGRLVEEQTSGESFTWLPEGRSVFRDKRIPRENLNGLLVGRTGMSAVLYTLTGVGGPWAQDPPYYTQVVAFETGDELDWTHTRLDDWRGWQHDRWIYFYHQGPIVVIDQAHGPANGSAAVAWHLAGQAETKGQRIRLRDGEHPVEMLLMPLNTAEVEPGEVEQQSDTAGPSVVYLAPPAGELHLATVFLFGEWVGAQVSWEPAANEILLSTAEGGRRLSLSLGSYEDP
jgi:hypothetical protein